MRYFSGVLAMLAVFVLSILILARDAGDLLIFSDLAALLPFIVVIAAVIFTTGELKTSIRGMNALLSKEYQISDSERERAIHLFGLLAKVVWCTAVVLVITGLMLMMIRLDDPSYLGPMLTVAFISLFYGALINLVFVYPAVYMLRHRKPVNPETAVISEKQVIDKLLQLCYKQGISPEEILRADEIELK